MYRIMGLTVGQSHWCNRLVQLLRLSLSPVTQARTRAGALACRKPELACEEHSSSDPACSHTRNSFIECSREAGIPLSGNCALHTIEAPSAPLG